MTGPRDWDKELANIDKLIGSAGNTPPPAPSQGVPAQRGPAPSSAPFRAATGGGAAVATSRPRDTLVVWLKAGLGAAGAGALMIWPYPKSCGTMLYGYLIGVAAIFGAGIWTMLAAWTHRRAFAHILGVLILLAAIGLGAAEILPRTGHMVPARTWVCPSTP